MALKEMCYASNKQKTLASALVCGATVVVLGWQLSLLIQDCDLNSFIYLIQKSTQFLILLLLVFPLTPL